MLFQKKNRYKPLYKKLLRLRTNLFQRDKVLKFKKKKWNLFKLLNSKRLRLYKAKRKHKKIKFHPNRSYFSVKDSTKYIITKRALFWCSYKKRYKNTLLTSLRFRLYYGGLKKKYIKRKIEESNELYNRQNPKKIKNLSRIFLELFEKRLDVTLYKAKFAFSVKSAQQLIAHGKILVNKKTVLSKAYILKAGDLIEVCPNFKDAGLVLKNMKKTIFWPIPPRNLIINYFTLQIIFNNFQGSEAFTSFNTLIPIHKLTMFYKWH